MCCAALQNAWETPLLDVVPGDDRPFLDLWWPLHALASSQLAAELNDASDDIDRDVYDQMADSLLTRLCTIGERVLWDRFGTDRSPGAVILAHLGASGDGSGPPLRAYFRDFIRTHRRDGLSQLLAQFPELGRLIGTVFVLWLRSSERMLRRVHADRDALARVFSVPAGHRLCRVTQGLSDPHRGGQAAAILTFGSHASDRPIEIVYKPKDLRVDAAYQALIRDINAACDLPPLRSIAIHASDGYGYMEHVSHRVCADEEELQRFYHKAGRLTALLHLLGCTDCHHENLIASGDQLVLIDTETLLEPELPDHVLEASSDAAVAKQTRLQERFLRSVLRSGLLPQWTFLGDAKYPVDVSALGIAPPARDEERVWGWLGINSDGMMPGAVRRIARLPTSLPVGVGTHNPFARHLDAFCAGFQCQCDVLIALRQSLWADGEPLSRFAGLPRRIVLRATRVYSAIQGQMLEPAALRSPLDLALTLEQLARSYLLAETRPLNWPVFAAERQQMRQLDIPFFTHLIDGDALQLNERGDEIPGFLASSGLASAQDRLRQLDAREIAFQLDLIRGVVQARQMRVADEESRTPDDRVLSTTIPASPSVTGAEAAARIARELCDRAIRDPRGYVEWLGPTLGDDGESFSFGPVGLSLFGGAIGVACLLGHLRNQPGGPPEADALRAELLRPLRDLIKQPSDENRRRWWRDQPLGLGGCGGVLLALQQLGETAIVDALVQAIRPRFLDVDYQRDLLGGCAGLIGPLLRVRSDFALRHAVDAGDHLLKHQSEEGGWGPAAEGRYLLGFSHGTAGYSAALAGLYRVTGQERFRAGAAAALALERSQFCPVRRNWPTHSGSPPEGEAANFMVHWCHGAPGIALGRACLWGTDLWDRTCEQEIGIAVHNISVAEDRELDHLCCGNLGLMAVLRILCSGPWPLDQKLRHRALEKIGNQRTQALLRCSARPISLRSAGARGQSLVLPGFFSGLSGMGLALLEDERSQTATAMLMSGGLLPDGCGSPEPEQEH